MKTKRILAAMALMSAICMPAFCDTPDATLTSASAPQQKNTTTVYVTKHRKKVYHKSNCPKLNIRKPYGKKQYEAEQEGYTPCKKCHKPRI